MSRSYEELPNISELDAVSIVKLIDRVNYWTERCQAAERFINESPCDPDITSDQLEAYQKWQKVKEEWQKLQ